MHVVHVVCTDAFAGVERHVTTLARGLDGAGVQVTVLGGQAERMTEALRGSDVAWLPAPTPAAAIRRILGLRSVDLVHAHMTAAELAAVVAARLVWRRRPVPVVATRHFPQTRGSSWPARRAGRLVSRRVAAQLAISQFVQDRTEGTSVVVLPGTPDRDNRAGATEREPMVLVAQRLEAEKRTEDALALWQRSGLAGEGWQLHVAGDGAQRPRLEALARELGIAGSTRFLGNRADIGELFQRASVLVAPLPTEALGLSVIEAMAAGLPVVAAAGGGHDETVGACPGAVLYPDGDLSRGAQLLADLARDPERRDRYGAALQSLQRERFSMRQQTRQTLDVYARVLG